MASLSQVRDGLVQLIQRLASEDLRYPLPEGTVTWTGSDVPFISCDLQAGIYLTITNLGGYGRSGKFYQSVTKPVNVVTANGLESQTLQVLEHWREAQGTLALRIQVKSTDFDPFGNAQEIASRIAGNFEEPFVGGYMRTLGLALIRTQGVVPSNEVTDGRTWTVATLDVKLQMVQYTGGLDALPIEHIRGTGQALGAVSGTLNQPIELDKPTP